jgi:hypothetical protein
MTTIDAAILWLLTAESATPMRVGVIHRTLSQLGRLPRVDDTPLDVEEALSRLLQDGKIEATWRRGVQHFRLMRPKPGRDMSEPNTTTKEGNA